MESIIKMLSITTTTTMLTKIDKSTSLEVTIISGESVNKNAFVRVKADSNYDQSTTLDATDNAGYPSWQQKFLINIPMHVNYFTLQVCCRKSTGDHVVGSVMVPTSDFMRECYPCDYLHFLSYRLRDEYGKRNGIVNLSVKVKSDGANKMSSNVAGTSGSTPVKGWSCGQGVSNGVVMGVPVQKQY